MRWKPENYRWLSIMVKHWGHTLDLNLQNGSDCDKWNLLTSGAGFPFFSGLALEGGMPSSLFNAALTTSTAPDFDLSFVYPSLLCNLPTPKITKFFVSVHWTEKLSSYHKIMMIYHYDILVKLQPCVTTSYDRYQTPTYRLRSFFKASSSNIAKCLGTPEQVMRKNHKYCVKNRFYLESFFNI